jgi:NAD(P)-dependent dehydrogenase (short-subunit alcohol dehydrogenase family)
VWNGARNIAARTGKSFDEAVEAMARLNPGGRLIEPAEIAAVAARLIRDDATNGEAIVLDGTALRAAGRPGAGAPPPEASLRSGGSE